MAIKRRRLARRRKSQGFSQESLAERLGVDPKTIRRWESGETEEGPQPWLRPKLAQCLQVSPEQLEELLAGDDEPATNDRVDYSLRNPAAADLRTVTGLRDEVHDLDERYDSAPSTSLLARTGHCLGQVAFLRANASNHRVRHELLAVEAEAATLMGQLVWDASQPGTTRPHMTTSTRRSRPRSGFGTRQRKAARSYGRASWRSTAKELLRPGSSSPCEQPRW